MIKIVLADDHNLFAEGLANLLRKNKDFSVEGVFNDGRKLISYLRLNLTHVALIDLNMPKMDGFTAIKHIKEEGIECKLIILSTYADEKLVRQAEEIGVDAYVLKDAEPDELAYTIKEVVEERYNFHINHILKQADSNDRYPEEFLMKYRLTGREIQIIQMIKDGLTTQEIAERLYLSSLTINTHRKNIVSKLGVKNTAGLVRFALENNL
ncbi:DNA-binding response regulator [Marivirga lumbricoides]|uniref:DNA-binding response regulator n=1 Tax=Marivirga lumbricoides TaxID=1046115 RepID=A0A2T4DQH5_9BACT|nr:DNA-binding response regulator [Marivirga lumbricoides]